MKQRSHVWSLILSAILCSSKFISVANITLLLAHCVLCDNVIQFVFADAKIRFSHDRLILRYNYCTAIGSEC